MISMFLENDGRFSIYISDISIWGNSLSVLMHMAQYNWFKHTSCVWEHSWRQLALSSIQFGTWSYLWPHLLSWLFLCCLAISKLETHICEFTTKSLYLPKIIRKKEWKYFQIISLGMALSESQSEPAYHIRSPFYPFMVSVGHLSLRPLVYWSYIP